MKEKNGVWGTYLGKFIALCLVLAFALGTVAVCMIYEQKRDVIVDLDDMPETDRKLSKDDDNVTVKFKLNKAGYYFTGYDTYRKDDGELVVKFYASLTKGYYQQNEDGYYTVSIPYTNKDKSLNIEGDDGIVTSLLDLKKSSK